MSDDTHPGGAVQKPRGFNDENPATNIALPHDGLSYRFPFHTEKRTYPYFDPIAQKAFDANYTGEEDVNGLTAYKFTQDVGYDADGKLAEPIRYPSLYADDADSKVTATACDVGCAGRSGREDHHDPLLRRAADLLGGPGVGDHRQRR